MVKKFFYSLVVILCFSQFSSYSSVVADTPAGAKSFIEDLGRRAIDSLTKPNVPREQLESSFAKLLDEGFNVPSIAKFVMGRYWKGMSDEQKDKFVPLFKTGLIKSYANQFQAYRGVVFVVKGARQEGSHVIVSSTIQKPGEAVTPVEWRVGGGKIRDVKVEGISMSVTLRDDYNGKVQSNNGDIDQFLSSIAKPVS